ncbi:MAG: ATP synthase subunit I [Clostridiaceae bacterium]
METQTRVMLKKILSIDIILVILTLILSYLTMKEYVLSIEVGLYMGIINFVASTITTSYSFKIRGDNLYGLIGSIIRLIITIIVGVLVYNNNQYNLLAFLGGYIVHHFSIVIYGLNIKNERK